MGESERIKRLDKLITKFSVKLKKIHSDMAEALVRMCYIQKQHLMTDKCRSCLALIKEHPDTHLYFIKESINQLQELLNFLESEVRK